MTAVDPETIPPRPDERLDAARLEPWLRAHLPRAEGPMTIRQFGGGHANLTYLVAFGEDEYVVRRPPLGPVAPSAHDMKREHRVLSRLPDAFPLAPRSLVLCTDTSVIGAEFHVMERRRGRVIRDTLPPGVAEDPDTCRRIAWMIVDTLADLHRVDAASVGLGELGRPEGFVERQLEGWARRWVAARVDDPGADEAIVDRAVEWLRGGMPRSDAVAILHNDFKLDNILVAEDDPARPVAVLDWDMCTRGDPLMDLGYLLSYWGEAGDDPAWRKVGFMPTWHPGFPGRRAAAERYAERTGLDIGEIHWYHVFGVFKLIVVLQQIYIRYLRGQTRDERFAAFGTRIANLIAKLDAILAAGET